MIPLLVLRPERGAVATAIRARALGLSPLIRSLFIVEPVPWTPPDPALFDALLLTSANAVRYGGSAIGHYNALPLFTVGPATAQAARDAGLRVVSSGSGTAADAIRAIDDAGYAHPLHLAGEHVTPQLIVPVNVTACIVYRAAPVAVSLPIGRSVALVHSARAAQRFAERCPAPDQVDIIAISAAVATAAGAGWRSIHIATTPNDHAMLELAAQLCDGQTMSDEQH